jgi:hypothetical protein
MGNFFQSGFWCLGEPQYAGKKRKKTIMKDELGEVKAKIAETEIKLSKAEAEGKEEPVLSLTNLLVGLNQKELLLLSAGEMHYNRCIMRYSVVADTADFSMIFTVGNLPR